MENLKKKANINIDAAKLLFDNKMHNPSIHCAYYGAFQLIMFAVCKKRKIDLSTLKSESKGTSSHDYTINQFYKIYSSTHRFIALDVRRDINAAKRFRHIADYAAEDMSIKDTERHLKLVDYTIKLLKKII